MAEASVLSTPFLLATLPAANGRGSCRGVDARAWRAELPFLTARLKLSRCAQRDVILPHVPWLRRGTNFLRFLGGWGTSFSWGVQARTDAFFASQGALENSTFCKFRTS
jgi:hypothetical protein